MSRLSIPTRDDAPDASKPVLDAVHAQLGVVPNMFRLIAQSPAALSGFAANNGALIRSPLGGTPSPGRLAHLRRSPPIMQRAKPVRSLVSR